MYRKNDLLGPIESSNIPEEAFVLGRSMPTVVLLDLILLLIAKSSEVCYQ